MQRESLIIYRSFYEAIKELPSQNQAEIWGAICELGFNNNLVELQGISKTVFILVKPQIEANYKKYLNGLKPKSKQDLSDKKAKHKQSHYKPQGNVNVNVNENENVNNTVNGIERKRDEFKKLIEPFKEKYTARLLNVFYEYWTASDLKSKKVRFENEKFFDVGRRLASWKRREKPTDYGPTDDGLVDYLKGKGKL
tara:strand:- start:4853 stop:5440 length:588 start_codon:yes stop_codon:yes gene_type:complete